MHTPDYNLLTEQLQALLAQDPYFVPALSNASALLWEEIKDINWAGFYLVRDGQLVLGPFQGKVACIHIQKGKGVCGTAWEKDETQLVPDVHKFPGHIACDSASNSEIVVPIHHDGEVAAVLDIDSPLFNRFSLEDCEGLSAFSSVLSDSLIWE
ncbi:MAG: GAF domain-containing protein [Oscillospiraceae bacterium]|nr:GAF domain-containing protein [Oscillospiraceae bacterium]MDO5138075.1 GAF domain-containing protein [Oscillospiraceae bacterium]